VTHAHRCGAQRPPTASDLEVLVSAAAALAALAALGLLGLLERRRAVRAGS